MGPTYVVSTDFVAHDVYSQRLRGMEASTKRFATDTKSQLKSIGAVFRGSFLGTFSSNLLSSGFARVTGALRSSVDGFISYENALTRAAMKFPEAADHSSEAFAKLTAGAQAMGMHGRHSAEDVAQGYGALAAAGYNVKDAIGTLPTIEKFAIAGNLGLSDATNIATKTMRQFGIAVDKVSTVGDTFTAVASSSRMSVDELYSAVQTGGGVFGASGQSLEQYLTMVGYLGQRGVPASRAAAGLAGAMVRISDPKIASRLKLMGVATSQMVGGKKEFRNFTDIVGDLQKKTAGLGDVAKNRLLEKIFDKRALRVMLPLFSEDSKALEKYTLQIEKSGGKAEKVASAIESTTANKIERIQGIVGEKGIEIVGKIFGFSVSSFIHTKDPCGLGDQSSCLQFCMANF
jgi:TP901 family phage tail tape measure protein